MKIRELFEGPEHLEYELHITPMRWEAEHEVSIDDMFDGDKDAADSIRARTHKDGVPKEFHLSDDDLNAVKETLLQNHFTPHIRLQRQFSDNFLSIIGTVYSSHEAASLLPRSYLEADKFMDSEELWIHDLVKEVIDGRKGADRFNIDIFPTGKSHPDL